MKNRMAILFVQILILAGCQSPRERLVEGTWRFVSGTSKVSDTTSSEYDQAQYSGLKMIHDNHFVFVGRFTSGADTVDNYGGGTYTLDGDTYTESVRYHSAKALVEMTVPFEVHVHNDTLVQTGPLNTGAFKNSKWKLREVYVRVR